MELVGGNREHKKDFLNGYFRDGIRRIDMVIVAKDTQNETIETMKMNFLMNAINIGLDVEIEAGASDKHFDLNFIKLHAPEHILQHFGLYYNVKKFFKLSHIEFISPGILDEKEIIQIIRRWYPTPQNFSTFERSQIVYKALLSVTFGTPENYIGINQLVDNSIFLDIYPLHDGPKQIVPGQTPLEMNGRQALFYNWCGYKNLLRQTPLNIVREYLGERIGFFFAFYTFYNCFLLLLAVFGAFVFYKNYDFTGRHLKLNENNETNEYKFLIAGYTYTITEAYKKDRELTTRTSQGTTYYEYPDLPMCPRCRDMIACPFRVMEMYGRELACKVFLDNPLGYYMAFATAIWGVLLYLLWTRKENYWYWIWETNEEDAKSLTRPEYRYLDMERLAKPKEIKVPKSSNERIVKSKIKEYKYKGSTKPKCRSFIEFLILFGAIVFACLLYPALLIECSNKLLNKIRYVEEAAKKLYPGNRTYPDYIADIDPKVGFQAIERLNHGVVDLVGSMNGIFLLGLEIGWYKLNGILLRRRAPRSEWLYERLHSSNLFGMTLLLNFVVVAFYAFVKGALYTFPDDDRIWQYPLQLGLLNCGLLYCMDEVFLVFFATQKTKLYFEQIMCSLTKLPTDQQYDPMDFVPPVVDRTPCWERELDLIPITEDFVNLQYNRLFLQIAVMMCFISVWPLGALVAFLWNLWNFKYLAKLLIVHGRRPLLTQTWSLGPWREILFILPYMACLTNALYLVRNNSLLDRKFNFRYWGHKEKRRFFADYFLGFFNTSDYNWSDPAKTPAVKYRMTFKNFNQTLFCMFPGQYNRMITGRRIYVNVYIPLAGKWFIMWRQTLFFLTFFVFVVGVSFLLNTVIGPVNEKVEDTKRVEDAVKQYGIEEMPKYKAE